MGSDKTVTQIRVDETLYERVKAIADKELRSVNNQIEFFLRQSVDRYDAEHRGETGN